MATRKSKHRPRPRIADPGWAFGASVSLTEDEASLLLQIVLPVADRVHKYVESGALSEAEADALTSLADQLECRSPSRPMEVCAVEIASLAKVLTGEVWCEVLALHEDEQRTFEAIQAKLRG